GEIVDQHEVLVHHADAQSEGLAAVGDVGDRAIDTNGAAVGGVEAVENGHEGGLAGTVLTHDAVDGAALDLEVDVLVGVDRPEALVDLFKLNGPAVGRYGCSGRFRPLRVVVQIAHPLGLSRAARVGGVVVNFDFTRNDLCLEGLDLADHLFGDQVLVVLIDGVADEVAVEAESGQTRGEGGVVTSFVEGLDHGVVDALQHRGQHRTGV